MTTMTAKQAAVAIARSKQTARSKAHCKSRGYQIRRVVLLLLVLQEYRHPADAGTLAEELNARMLENWSRRTISRDLIILDGLNLVESHMEHEGRTTLRRYSFNGFENLDFISQWDTASEDDDYSDLQLPGHMLDEEEEESL